MSYYQDTIVKNVVVAVDFANQRSLTICAGLDVVRIGGEDQEASVQSAGEDAQLTQ